MIQFSYDNWKIKLDSFQAQQFDDNCIEVQFNGEFPTDVTWSLYLKYGKHFDMLPLTNVDDEDEQLTLILDKDHLSFSGAYYAQLVGTWEDEDDEKECTRHTNKVEFYLASSLDSSVEWNPIPNAIETELNGMSTIVCAAYDSTQSYSVGDIAIYKRRLYICTATTTGTWDSTKWSATSYSTVANTKFALASAITDMATKTWVNAQGFITSLAGYATEAWVLAKGYLTDAPSDNKEYARKNGAWTEVTDTGAIAFDDLTNRPNYNGTTMTHATAIPEVKTATWDAKYAKPSGGIPKTDLASDVQTSLGKADTALQEHQSLAAYRTSSAQDVIDATKEVSSNKVTSIDAQSTDAQYPSAKCVNDKLSEQSSVIANKEASANKVTSISSASTDVQYPSAKCVYDLVGNIESALSALR